MKKYKIIKISLPVPIDANNCSEKQLNQFTQEWICILGEVMAEYLRLNISKYFMLLNNVAEKLFNLRGREGTLIRSSTRKLITETKEEIVPEPNPEDEPDTSNIITLKPTKRGFRL